MNKPRLVPGGLALGEEVVPLHAGSVHYWRLDPADWRACLLALKGLGLRLVDTYVPWAVHEVAPGVLELGQTDPRRDLGRFLDLAKELGLYVILRPGPHINAELTCFGIPERVIWDPACQARTPQGNPVMLPMVPLAFPVPSYGSQAFLEEAKRYFEALGPTVAPHLWPKGPVVLLQIDNEGALYFRDGVYDQDYHPDTLEAFRDFLRRKYGTLEALESAYGGGTAPGAFGSGTAGSPTLEGSVAAPEEPSLEALRFSNLLPPKRFDATTPSELARHLDWAEFHEHLLTGAFERLARDAEAAGMGGVPTMHNFPLGSETSPLNAARTERVLDLVGLDYYHVATPESRTAIARRTSELAVRCEASGVPAFACELGAGYPPFFPPLDEQDSTFTVLAGLAYGLRGFNVYMAVDRDRWLGAPIDSRGRARPFASFWSKLLQALETTRFHTLRRAVPVRLMVPRSQRRLMRVMHAFGPISGAYFSVSGAGPQVSVSEEDLGLGYPLGLEGDAFTRAMERALEVRGVPFAHVGGEDRAASLDGARWVLCSTSGGLHPGLARVLQEGSSAGVQVTLGPRVPAFDAGLRPLALESAEALVEGFAKGRLPGLLRDDPAEIDAVVARAIEDLNLPTYACGPEGVHATVHEDAEGKPRVLFVLNPGPEHVVAHVALRGTGPAVDLLSGSRFEPSRGGFEVRMAPRRVRMLALEARPWGS